MHNHSLTVSVIIPVYNEEKYLGACLKALLKQTEPADEIIVINNNCTDASMDIARKYDVTIINEPHQGMIPARNRGFDEAKYDIIARTDADTLVPPNWIRKIKKHFMQDNIVAVSGPSRFYEVPKRWSPNTVFNLDKLYFRVLREVLGHECLSGPNMALQKKAWEKIKDEVCLNDRDVHEDIDLGIHISALGEIKFDKTLVANTSFRRFKKTESYLEYPYKVITSIRKHEKFTMRARSKKMVKKLVEKTLMKAESV